MPWRREWHPLQYSCLENHMDRGAWWATVYRVTHNRTWLRWLSTQRSCGIQLPVLYSLPVSLCPFPPLSLLPFFLISSSPVPSLSLSFSSLPKQFDPKSTVWGWARYVSTLWDGGGVLGNRIRRRKQIHNGPEWSVVPRTGARAPRKLKTPVRRQQQAVAPSGLSPRREIAHLTILKCGIQVSHSQRRESQI